MEGLHLNSGRPVEMKDKKRGMPLTFYIDQEKLDQLQEIRWRERKSASQLIRIALEEYIKNHASGNSTFVLDKWNEDPNFQAVPALFADREIWFSHYKESDEKDRTKLRIQAVDLSKIFRTVDINENRK